MAGYLKSPNKDERLTEKILHFVQNDRLVSF